MATSKVSPSLEALPPVVREALLKCSPQEQRFVIAYCGRAAGNGVLAVKLAGGKGDYGSRAAQSSDMLRKPEVMAARDAWMSTYAMGAAEVTFHIADMSHCSLEPFLEIEPKSTTTKVTGKGKKRKRKTISSGGGIRLKEQTDESWARHAHWIKDIEVDPKSGRITKLRVHDRGKYLELIAKILKLHSDAPQVNLFLYLQGLSDEELLKEYETAANQAGLGGGVPLGPLNVN